jgi:hypothetical protein
MSTLKRGFYFLKLIQEEPDVVAFAVFLTALKIDAK